MRLLLECEQGWHNPASKHRQKKNLPENQRKIILPYKKGKGNIFLLPLWRPDTGLYLEREGCLAFKIVKNRETDKKKLFHPTKRQCINSIFRLIKRCDYIQSGHDYQSYITLQQLSLVWGKNNLLQYTQGRHNWSLRQISDIIKSTKALAILTFSQCMLMTQLAF